MQGRSEGPSCRSVPSGGRLPPARPQAGWRPEGPQAGAGRPRESAGRPGTARPRGRMENARRPVPERLQEWPAAARRRAHSRKNSPLDRDCILRWPSGPCRWACGPRLAAPRKPPAPSGADRRDNQFDCVPPRGSRASRVRRAGPSPCVLRMAVVSARGGSLRAIRGWRWSPRGAAAGQKKGAAPRGAAPCRPCGCLIRPTSRS